MTRSHIARRSCIALLAGLTTLLAACGGGGGGGSDGSASIRVVNATSDLAAIDVYLGSTKSFPNSAVDTLGTYATTPAQSYDIKVTGAGSTTSLFTGTYALSKDRHYTAVVTGSTGALKLVTLPEDDDTSLISTGSGRIRIYNAASAESGSFDVHLTQPTDVLSAGTAIATGVTSGTLGAYKELAAGSYRLRITATGNTASSYVRLDIPSVTLTAQKYVTLIITAGPSGVLVNSAALEQQGALAQYKNTKARLRVVAGVEGAGNVSALVDGSTAVAGLVSPKVGPYAFVDAGSRTVDVRVGGTSIATPVARTFAAGGDYTLLTYGAVGAVQTQLVNDDNRLPTAGRYKMRLVNSAVNASLVTLSIDLSAVISDLPVGSAAGFVSGLVSTTKSNIRVDTDLGTTPYAPTDQQLLSQGIYSMFILGGGTAPQGALIKEN